MTNTREEKLTERACIPGAAAIMNFVVLSTALSSCNTGIYSTGRMLRDLGANGDAPKIVQKLNKRRLPMTGLVVSTFAMSLGIVVNVVSSDRAFTYITSVGACGGLWTWSMILVSHLR